MKLLSSIFFKSSFCLYAIHPKNIVPTNAIAPDTYDKRSPADFSARKNSIGALHLKSPLTHKGITAKTIKQLTLAKMATFFI